MATVCDGLNMISLTLATAPLFLVPDSLMVSPLWMATPAMNLDLSAALDSYVKLRIVDALIARERLGLPFVSVW